MDENIKEQFFIFPCGLNERSKDLIPGTLINTNFYPIGSSGEGNNRCQKNRNSRHSKFPLTIFKNFFKVQMASKSKDAFIKIQKIEETCKKKTLKK